MKEVEKNAKSEMNLCSRCDFAEHLEIYVHPKSEMCAEGRGRERDGKTKTRLTKTQK